MSLFLINILGNIAIDLVTNLEKLTKTYKKPIY